VGLALLGFALGRIFTPIPATLRADYLASLRRFQSIPYVWGGEDGGGVDCSGLVRAALRESAWRLGIVTLNPRWLAVGWQLTVSDFRAREFGVQADLFESLGRHDDINHLPAAVLKPGDVAVTHDGTHALAYLGEDTWIEANRAAGRVILVRVPENDIAHYRRPVFLYRWREL
jgi:cell wall-associated NlpC family hydrolase